MIWHPPRWLGRDQKCLLGLKMRKCFWLTRKRGLKKWKPLHSIEILIWDCQKSYYFIPDLLFFFKYMNKISYFYQFSREYDKDSQLWNNILVSKKQLVGNINNIIVNLIIYNSSYVICKKLSSLSVVKEVGLICQKALGNACW